MTQNTNTEYSFFCVYSSTKMNEQKEARQKEADKESPSQFSGANNI